MHRTWVHLRVFLYGVSVALIFSCLRDFVFLFVFVEIFLVFVMYVLFPMLHATLNCSFLVVP